MAYNLSELPLMASERRVRVNAWTMDSPHSGCGAFQEAAVRDNDRSRKRWLWESGGVTHEPFLDDDAPRLERISRLMPLYQPWTRIGIIIDIAHMANLQGIHLRRSDRELRTRILRRTSRNEISRIPGITPLGLACTRSAVANGSSCGTIAGPHLWPGKHPQPSAQTRPDFGRTFGPSLPSLECRGSSRLDFP